MSCSPIPSTAGSTFFTQCGSPGQWLFRVNSGIPVEDALEHASNLLGCVQKLTLNVAMSDNDEAGVWAAHYLGEIAKAIIDDALGGAWPTEIEQ